MSNETSLAIRGFAGTTPNIHDSRNGGLGWTWFRFGSTRSRRQPSGEWLDEATVWFTVRASGALAHRVCALVRKGTPLLVRGTLADDTWIDDAGRSHPGMAIRADAVAIDISGRGTVSYTPPPRSAAVSDDGEGAGEGNGLAAASDGAGDSSADQGATGSGEIVEREGVEYEDVSRFVGSEGVSVPDVTELVELSEPEPSF